MDESLIKIDTTDVQAYSPTPTDYYRSQHFPDDFGASTIASYGLHTYQSPPHVADTRFLMDSLDAAALRQGYLDVQPDMKTFDVTQYPPHMPSSPPLARAVSTAASVSDSLRSSSDSDVEDADDADVDVSSLSKEELRKHKNRQSAARSRKRNRDRMGQLEVLVRQLSVKNRQLEEQIQVLLLERTTVGRHAHVPHQSPHVPHPQFHAPHQHPHHQQQHHFASHVPMHSPFYH